jgi:hypothetical protein
MNVLHEMVRVLSPGGRIAVMTTYCRESFMVRKGLELGAGICGMRVFDRTTICSLRFQPGLPLCERELANVGVAVAEQVGAARQVLHVPLVDLFGLDRNGVGLVG